MVCKLNIGNVKDGKTYKKELSDEELSSIVGKKLGESFKGNLVGFDGYEFIITGGSDACGFPMRWDVAGSARKRILISKSIGMRNSRKGLRLRKTVVGNTVFEKTAQLNVKVSKVGNAPLGGDSKSKEDSSAEPSVDKKE